MRQDGQRWNNWVVGGVVFMLAIAPLFLVREAEFGGADGEAEAAIQEMNPNYQPWFSPLIEPASGEIESLLFALQAALGAGVLGYVMGVYRGRREQQVAQPPLEVNHSRLDLKDH